MKKVIGRIVLTVAVLLTAFAGTIFVIRKALHE
jgi:hypothetical protein